MLASANSPALSETSRSSSPASLRATYSPRNSHAQNKPRHKSSSSSLKERQLAIPRSGSGQAQLQAQQPQQQQQQQQRKAHMVDVGTQWSPPDMTRAVVSPTTGKRKERSPSPPASLVPPEEPALPPEETPKGLLGKAKDAQPSSSSVPPVQARYVENSPKKPKAEAAKVKVMPVQYETCDTKDLVMLISGMLMDLIRFNDAIPLRDGQLTRFHSRAPPGISVQDYLQRLTTHATLSPPILLSMVFLIDRLCSLYPAFTISSLTVHRFLIAAATVASKGLSDSFWTNNMYARVGGVSVKELALLELELLWRVDWRIVPQPEVLEDYYRSLIERSEGFQLAGVQLPPREDLSAAAS